MTQEEALNTLMKMRAWRAWGKEQKEEEIPEMPEQKEVDEAFDVCIKLLQQSSLPSNLDETANSYSESDEPLYSPGHRFYWDEESLFGKQIETAFIAGAEWQKKRFEAEYELDWITDLKKDLYELGRKDEREQMKKDAVGGSEEIWKPVVGYDGYEVSNRGRVISRKHSQDGTLLTQQTNHSGYKYVALRDKDYSAHICLIHRLVAEAFIPNPEGKRTVNHKNENKADNCVSNLEWATHREQCNYGTRRHPEINSSMYDENGRLSREFIELRLYLRKRGYLLDDKNLVAYWTPNTKRSKTYEGNHALYRYKEFNGEEFEFLPFSIRPRIKVERIDKNGNVVLYKSMAEAARKNCVSVSFIQRRITGKGGTSGNGAKLTDYTFRIPQDDENIND